MKGRLLDAVPLSSLTGVGAALSNKLAKINLHTVQDLLLHLPLRYEDRTHLYPIGELLPGVYATVEGEVLNCNISFGGRRMMTCQISDGSGILTMRFFNFSAAMKNSLATGRRVLAYGEAKRGKYGAEMIHPEYRVQGDLSTPELQETLTPVYPTTEGVKQATLRKLTDQALDLLDTCAIEELLPPELSQGMMTLPEALRTLHRPPPTLQLSDLETGQHPAQRRLILEELLAHNLSMLALRAGAQRFHAQPLSANDALKNKLLAALPFKQTGAQARVVAEIERDMALDVPMMRLVQGDVGSGKTLVAALAALRAIAHGKQVALMAPTELLAEQHANNFRNWFEPLGIEVGWLAGKQKGKARLSQQEAIASGQVQMIVGTHAIFQEQVQFNGLALVIIDEQHRFGVHQRLALWEKGQQQGFHPHQLIMTATPIPRTLAMTAYADLDTSVIDELPPGRTPVTTVAIPDPRRTDIIDRVRHACITEGRQAYWVCTLIEESELLEAQAAEATWEELKLALPELNVGLVHGRMKPAEKQAVMASFKQGELHLLVATTVIEVGVDVPNASLMIIENPERLGLAQLHQLRGRVGRGAVASHCVLLYKTPLSKTAQIRLQVLRDSNDGFVIAQKDLEIRGPGELLGTRQTGNAEFKVADLLRDQAMIPEVQRLARHIHERYPQQAKALIERWMPETERYSNALPDSSQDKSRSKSSIWIVRISIASYASCAIRAAIAPSGSPRRISAAACTPATIISGVNIWRRKARLSEDQPSLWPNGCPQPIHSCDHNGLASMG
ncbi:ATP-dependent DNA helicase RecG [Escherichia coli P0299483.1]|nr:ATP-dependent DNA helicase RecG [Escherichia coli]END65190.1 ATP-dependent DNA helicase RecG [Escherichia coli P0299483.1]